MWQETPHCPLVEEPCHYSCLWTAFVPFPSEVESERWKHALQAEHPGEYGHSFCFCHRCSQRLHHSLRRTAAQPGTLSTFLTWCSTTAEADQSYQPDLFTKQDGRGIYSLPLRTFFLTTDLKTCLVFICFDLPSCSGYWCKQKMAFMKRKSGKPYTV